MMGRSRAQDKVSVKGIHPSFPEQDFFESLLNACQALCWGPRVAKMDRSYSCPLDASRKGTEVKESGNF